VAQTADTSASDELGCERTPRRLRTVCALHGPLQLRQSYTGNEHMMFGPVREEEGAGAGCPSASGPTLVDFCTRPFSS
jgi:hypothetical protein